MDSIAKIYLLRPLNHVDNDLAAALRWPRKLPHQQSKTNYSCRTTREIDIFHFGRWHSKVPFACCRLWAMHQVALWWDKLLLLVNNKNDITFDYISVIFGSHVVHIFMNNSFFLSNQSKYPSLFFRSAIHTKVQSIFFQFIFFSNRRKLCCTNDVIQALTR